MITPKDWFDKVCSSPRLFGKDAELCTEIVQTLFCEKVCPRCVLRIVGHPVYEDYLQPVGSTADLLSYVNQSQASAERQAPVGEEPSNAAVGTSATCEGTAPGTSAHDPCAHQEIVGQKRPDGPALNDSQTAAKRQQIADGTPAANTQPGSGHEQPGNPTTDSLAGSPRCEDSSASRECHECSLCLGIMQLFDIQDASLPEDSRVCTTTTTNPDPNATGDTVGSTETSAVEGDGGALAQADVLPTPPLSLPLRLIGVAALSKVAEKLTNLPFSSIGMEVSCPGSTALREFLIHKFVTVQFGSKGVFKGKWYPGDIVSIRLIVK
eukprot:gene15195-21270_t